MDTRPIFLKGTKEGNLLEKLERIDTIKAKTFKYNLTANIREYFKRNPDLSIYRKGDY